MHEGGYRLEAVEAELRFFRPDGTPIPATPRSRASDHGHVGRLERRRGVHNDRETAFPLSAGERMDLGAAILAGDGYLLGRPPP